MGVPVPYPEELELMHPGVPGDSIPEDCVAYRVSRDGRITFLTEDEYLNLIGDETH